MSDPANLNNLLALQAERLHRVVTLIENKNPWLQWDQQDRDAIAIALWPIRAGDFENMKAKNLAKHLFRADAPECNAFDTSEIRQIEADRLRADLPGLVRLGAAKFLLSQIECDADNSTGPAIR